MHYPENQRENFKAEPAKEPAPSNLPMLPTQPAQTKIPPGQEEAQHLQQQIIHPTSADRDGAKNVVRSSVTSAEKKQQQ